AQHRSRGGALNRARELAGGFPAQAGDARADGGRGAAAPRGARAARPRSRPDCAAATGARGRAASGRGLRGRCGGGRRGGEESVGALSLRELAAIGLLALAGGLGALALREAAAWAPAARRWLSDAVRPLARAG